MSIRSKQPISAASLTVATAVILLSAFFVGTRAAPNEQPATDPSSTTSNNPGIVFSSGRKKVSLIELYTSEGCSSCPPADRWLSALGDSPALWHNVVPVAFHVSYWDRLGWPDRFAQPQFDSRQRALAARADAGVYTPGLFRDGKEFRSWRTPPQAINASTMARGNSPDAGQLSISNLTGNQWQVSYEQSGSQIKLQKSDSTHYPVEVFAAVLGNNLSNAIERGENAGKRLDHNFVVLQLERAVLRSDTTNAQTLQATFDLNTNVTANPAVAAWVTGADGVPMQAVGGTL